MEGMFDLGEIMKRLFKYLVEGLAVAAACCVIPKKSLAVNETLTIALMAAATFSVLDAFVPSIADSARSGAGFGIGANLVGFPKM